jgi:hypothetical protein
LRQMTPEEHAALLARHAEDERTAREGCERATLQHVLAGRCGGMDPDRNRAHLRELRQQLDQLRRGVRGGGQQLLRAAAVAYVGVAAAARRDAVRREREGRVGAGPSARTRECSTVPERERRRRGDGRDARRPAGATLAAGADARERAGWECDAAPPRVAHAAA